MHAKLQTRLQSIQGKLQTMTYTIKPDPAFPATADQISYAITMETSRNFHVTITSSTTGVQQWLELAMQYQATTVGIHFKLRRSIYRFLKRFLPSRFQTDLAILLVALGDQVLLLQLLPDEALPEMLVEKILGDDHLKFVGMDIVSTRDRLRRRGLTKKAMEYVTDVKDPAAEHVGGGELFLVQQVLSLLPLLLSLFAANRIGFEE